MSGQESRHAKCVGYGVQKAGLLLMFVLR